MSYWTGWRSSSWKRGWSFKHLHRLIVTSRAYRMRTSDSGPGDPNVALDPDNRYFWRMNVRRMEGEIVRDSILFLAGRLDPKIGGPDAARRLGRSGHPPNHLLPLCQRRQRPSAQHVRRRECDRVLPPP